jgi:hypothetical protein
MLRCHPADSPKAQARPASSADLVKGWTMIFVICEPDALSRISLFPGCPRITFLSPFRVCSASPHIRKLEMIRIN